MTGRGRPASGEELVMRGPFVELHLRLGALQAYYLKRFKCVINAARPFSRRKE
jgi:hypothetical protein